VPDAPDYRDQEITYWQQRAEAAEERIRQAGEFFPDVPPEPPVGTEYLDGGEVWWRRTGDGWYCARVSCSACPAEWGDVWESQLARGRLTRRLPGVPDRGVVSPERDRHP
jgi:hypothetical protein